MKYIKQGYAAVKPFKFSGNTYYQIGTDDWNIVVGLGGLAEIMGQAQEIVRNRMEELEEE